MHRFVCACVYVFSDIISSAAPCFTAARAWLRFGATGRVSRASAAGVNWTCRTANAGWIARATTSVVDATGAIYVIGGYNDEYPFFQDVWASTDGGARAGLGLGVVGG